MCGKTTTSRSGNNGNWVCSSDGVVVMASLIDKRVDDVGAKGQNTSPDSKQKDDSANKKATCEGIFEVALRWKPEKCSARLHCTAFQTKNRPFWPVFRYFPMLYEDIYLFCLCLIWNPKPWVAHGKSARVWHRW